MPLPPISSGSGGIQPGTPTIGTATAGNASASVTFTAPSYLGKPTGTTYTATSTPSDITGTSATSPITVSGLSNGTAYTFKVKLGNGVATSLESASSNSATPVAPPPPPPIIATPPPIIATPPPSLTVSGVSSSSITSSSVVISWSSTAQQYASVTVGPTNVEITGSGTSTTVGGLTFGTSYTPNVTVYSACCPPSGSTASASGASFNTLTHYASGCCDYSAEGIYYVQATGSSDLIALQNLDAACSGTLISQSTSTSGYPAAACSPPPPPPPPIIATPPPIIATPPPIIATPPPIIATPPTCDCIYSDGGDTYYYRLACGTAC